MVTKATNSVLNLVNPPIDEIRLVTPLAASYGGTGRTSLPEWAVIIGNGTSQVQTAAPTIQAYPLVSNGSNAFPTFQALDLTNSITGVLGVPNGGTGRQDIEQYAVVMGNGTNPLEWVNVTASPYPLISNGTSAFATFQPLDLSSNAVTGVLSLSHIPNIPFSFLTGTIPLSDLPFSPYSTYITDIGAASWTASFTGYIMVEGWGGGGGSSQSASVGIAVCYGAASGGYFRTVDYVVQGDVINYVVGDGGANAGSFGVTGDTGGTTVWNGYAAAFGGTGSSNTVTGLGGSASGGNVLNLHGRPGEVGDNISRIGGAGGAAPLGGAGGQDDYASGHDGFQPGGGASGPGSTVGYDGNRGGRGAISITRIY
jgi:hypothetical protein